MISFQCKRCGSTNTVRLLSEESYLFKDNKLVTSRDRCYKCRCNFVYVKKSDETQDVVFPNEDYGFCKRLKEIRNIYTSYIPIPSLIDSVKNKILELKGKDDIVIGFDGWEDIVIDKELAGGWYMTYNSPPILDVAIINCASHCFGEPKIITSYCPSPVMNLDFSILDDRTVEYFDSERSLMLSEHRKFYIGIKE